MAKRRGVLPTTTRVALSEGDWVDLRESLTAGERDDVTSLAWRGHKSDGTWIIDPATFNRGTIAQYVAGWSFVGQNDQPMKWPAGRSLTDRVAALGLLDEASLAELGEAVRQHTEALAARKNGSGGETPAAIVSPSASTSDGIGTT